jgi:uncharacterized UBP type Zn finger protein
MRGRCSHVAGLRTVRPQWAGGCRDCLARGDAWVDLRLCLACGYVGCGEHSRNKHAAAHFRRTRHAVVQSLERGDHWRWCYVDKARV